MASRGARWPNICPMETGSVFFPNAQLKRPLSPLPVTPFSPLSALPGRQRRWQWQPTGADWPLCSWGKERHLLLKSTSTHWQASPPPNCPGCALKAAWRPSQAGCVRVREKAGWLDASNWAGGGGDAWRKWAKGRKRVAQNEHLGPTVTSSLIQSRKGGGGTGWTKGDPPHCQRRRKPPMKWMMGNGVGGVVGKGLMWWGSEISN